MEQDGYQVVTDIEEIRQYVEAVGGFSGFALGNLQFDSSGLAFSIEEVVEGEDWPREAAVEFGTWPSHAFPMLV